MKKLILLAALLALASCADSPEDRLTKAQEAFAANDYPAARIHLAAALAKKPGDQAMLALQARTLLALGDGEGARVAIEQLAGSKAPTGELAEMAGEAALLRAKPDLAVAALAGLDSVEAERIRALAAIQQEDNRTAIIHFERGLAEGGNARLLADYARFKLIAGDVAGATELAAKAASIAPHSIDTLLIAGQLAVRRGDLKSALDLYEDAARRYPSSLAALIGKAAVLGDLGRRDEMKAVLDRAAAFAPRAGGILFLRAKAAAQGKDWAGVRAIVQPVETGLDQIDPVRLIYGEALLRLGQVELATAQFEPIVRSVPGNRDARRLLGEARLASGDAKGAMEVLRPVADLPFAVKDELALMAKAARAAGDPAAARYEARSRQPEPQALGRDLATGDAAMKAGNWAGASAAYQRLLDNTDGTSVVVLNNMAYAQAMLGNFNRARTLADRALKLAPDNASVLDTAGWVRIKSGQDVENGKRLLRKGAQQAPGNMTIRAHLAEAERAKP
ncbi:tetratricopeptide repeat protein [Novosphingobium kunmingense]|uniref:Tetratricopeptide repeat protein n=1 Tax=Novosphingobium kunmingense TaxID=1211806 RepID=A0A2N0I2K3_9SPHN|nr:tetratricopeptide repeat protein [Novosphingobium kunmingense]PKB25412.1 tetratricopeptide repeat protein [Novosphingobium kunmingense]